jgi:hypothetical protein
VGGRLRTSGLRFTGWFTASFGMYIPLPMSSQFLNFKRWYQMKFMSVIVCRFRYFPYLVIKLSPFLH